MDCCVFGFDMTAVIAASLCLSHTLIKCIQNVCVSTVEEYVSVSGEWRRR